MTTLGNKSKEIRFKVQKVKWTKSLRPLFTEKDKDFILGIGKGLFSWVRTPKIHWASALPKLIGQLNKMCDEKQG